MPHHPLPEPLPIEGVLADEQRLHDALYFRLRGAVQEAVNAPCDESDGALIGRDFRDTLNPEVLLTVEDHVAPPRGV